MGLRCRGEKFKPGGRLFGLEIGLGLGFFLCLFFLLKFPPFVQVLETSIYRKKCC